MSSRTLFSHRVEQKDSSKIVPLEAVEVGVADGRVLKIRRALGEF